MVLEEKSKNLASSLAKRSINDYSLVDSLSLVFPAYNEAENLPSLIEYVSEVVPKFVSDFEAIVVDDGSRDNSSEILAKLKRRFPWLKPKRHDTNLGYGKAVKTGLLSATKEYVFFTDADLQFDLNFLGCFLPYLKEYKAVLGYRAPRVDSWIRKLNAWLWRILIMWLFRVKIQDVDCAFKVFHRELLDTVAQAECEGAMFSAELLIRIKMAGYSWYELPVKHFARKAGMQTGAKFTVILKAFKELFSFYLRYYRGNLRTTGDQ